MARRLLLLALLLRFSIPAVAVLNEQVYRLFLDQQYTEAIDGLEQGKQTLTEFAPLSDRSDLTAETGIMASLKETARQLQQATDLRLQIERLGAKLSVVVKDLLAMIVIFLLNTILFPFAFLWALYKLFGKLIDWSTWFQPAALVAAPVASPAVIPAETGQASESKSAHD